MPVHVKTLQHVRVRSLDWMHVGADRSCVVSHEWSNVRGLKSVPSRSPSCGLVPLEGSRSADRRHGVDGLLR